MKFLCDNCKAKYQIADEKVAGKTVRMKCRKCGHQIEVRAAVTETSVSTSPPTAGASDTETRAPRPMAKSSLATSLSAQKPRAPLATAPHGGALAGAFQRTVQDAPQSVPYPGSGGGGNNPVELSVTDEWYVAINGVPVGPVRISELRRKAASGAVTEDSLCWQEGLEEWRPVRSIPELAAIVREAAQGNRPSLISPPLNEGGRQSSPSRPPPAARPQSPSRSPEPPRTEPPAREPPRPFNPSPGAPGRSNVVPLRVAASSTSDDGPPITSPLQTGHGGAGAAAALAPAFSPAPAPAFAPQVQMQPAPPPAPMAISDPFAVPPGPAPAAAGMGMAPLTPSGNPSLVSAPAYSPPMAPPAPKRGVPLWFWPILLFTGVFGASAAVFVFRQQQQPAPVVIQMPATNAPTATAAPHDVPPPTPSNEPSAATSAPTATGGKVATNTVPRTGGGPATPEKKGGIDLGNLVPGAGGPNVGVGGGPGPGTGGGGLDSSSVERVVASHRQGVKRTCWERGGADQKSSVNVMVSATVAPDGSVSNTSSSGDDPVVAKCIESQVRSWRFSAPGSSTTVNIPFKFVRQ